MDIGIKIAQARRDLGITQIELAEKMNVTRQTVSRWESGAALPDLEKVVNLADILHVSCDYLMIDRNSNREDLSSVVEEETITGSGAVTRLLSALEGNRVKITLFDEDEYTDTYDKICRIDGFEGNWIKITVFTNKEEQVKLVPLSSVLSFDILDTEGK